MKAPYFGLSGRRLHIAIWIQSLVAVTIFGYNSAGAGGVLNLPSFEARFPSLDVQNAPPDQVHHKSTIQGEQFLHQILSESTWLISVLLNRDGRSTLYSVWCFWSISLHLFGRFPRTSENHIHCCGCQFDRGHPDGQFLFSSSVHLWSNFHWPGDWWNRCNCSRMAIGIV